MISSVILTKNEASNIASAIDSASFSNEVIVVDDYSTEATAEIARKLGAKIFKRRLAGDFASQRNFGLSKAKGDWVFFLDADETVTPRLRREIIKSTNLKIFKYSGYWIRRKNLFLGKVVGEDKVLRLAKKDAGRWERIVHEEWKVKGRVGTLKGYLVHDTAVSLREAISKTNYYSSLHATANIEEGKRSSLFRIIFFPAGKLLENLAYGKGFTFALLHSLHSFLAWSKQWLLQQKLA